MAATTTQPTLTRLVLNTPNMTTAQLQTVLNLNTLVSTGSGQRLANYVQGGTERAYPQNWLMSVGAANASGTLTITSTGPTNNQTFSVAGVTFTAKTSGATGNQFNISSTPSVVAANIAAAVNASSSTVGLVTASNAAGVVTFTSAVPGVIGNLIALSAGTLSNATASGSNLASGAEGNAYTINML